MYRLIHADCLQVLQSMPAQSIDCIFTDPPYIISAPKNATGLAGQRNYHRRINEANIHVGFDPVILVEFLRVVKKPNIFVFCSRQQLRDYLNWAHENDLYWSLLCWHKPNPIPLTAAPYLPDTEYILHFYHGLSTAPEYHGKRKFHVLPCERHGFDHPTVKPLRLVKTLLANANPSLNSVVLDPFMGTGTTGVAALELGHQFIGVEHSARYLQIATDRLAGAMAALSSPATGELNCSTSKPQITKNSKSPGSKSTPVFKSWSGPPLQN